MAIKSIALSAKLVVSTVELVDDAYRTIDESWLFTALSAGQSWQPSDALSFIGRGERQAPAGPVEWTKTAVCRGVQGRIRLVGDLRPSLIVGH